LSIRNAGQTGPNRTTQAKNSASTWYAFAGHLSQSQTGAVLDAADGAAAIYQRPRTSRPAPENQIYPYLLRGLAITRVNQV
jgi:hypothetical protein